MVRMENKEALSLGLNQYLPVRPCKRGHMSERLVKGGCLVCRRETTAQWKRDNKERHAALNRKCFQNSPSLQAAKNTSSLLRFKNRPELSRYAAAKRRAIKKLAMPSWADTAKIKAIYAQAQASGMEVDHIVPLNNPMVCGLHCESNMQLLTPTENARKNNKFFAGWE